MDYVCDQTVGIVPTIQAGTVNGLVVATEQRIPVAPDVPTSVEQGTGRIPGDRLERAVRTKGHVKGHRLRC